MFVDFLSLSRFACFFVVQVSFVVPPVAFRVHHCALSPADCRVSLPLPPPSRRNRRRRPRAAIAAFVPPPQYLPSSAISIVLALATAS
jgi:hypothetical protein